MHWNCNAWSQSWSTEMAQFFSTTTPDCMLHNQFYKSWTNWATKFCLIYHIHLTSCQLTTTFLDFSTSFSRENASTISRRQTCFPRVHQIPKHGFLCYRNKPTYFSLPKITVMVPILINKDVFEPCWFFFFCCCCSVAQSCPTLCNPMDCSTPGFPVLHHVPELAQTHVYFVDDTIWLSHPLPSPSPPAFKLSQYQGLFSSLHQMAKVLKLQHQSFQWIFRVDFL